MKDTKIALITGGNRGIGYAIAEELIKADVRVIIEARSLYSIFLNNINHF